MEKVLKQAVPETVPLSLQEKAVEIFRSLLKINTVNPPGNEEEAILYLKGVLEREGISCKVLLREPKRANLVARISGGGEGPLILASHVDVVPFDREEWSVDPLSGVMKDGWIYGRGAVDMKHFVAMSTAVFLLAHSWRQLLNRDLVLVVTCDEEMGSRLGMEYLCTEHFDLLKGKYGITEVGGFPIYIGKKVLFPVQVGEKGFLWLKGEVEGRGGHGSIPHDDQAILHFLHAVGELVSEPLTYHRSRSADLFFRELGKSMGVSGKVLPILTRPPFLSLFLSLLDEERKDLFRAILHNTVSVTVVNGGDKTNVIPSRVEFQLDGRFLPGISRKAFLKEIQQRLGEKVHLSVLRYGDPQEVSLDTPLYEAIRKVVSKNYPSATIIPSLTTGFTDGKWLIEKGVNVYGFTPLLLPRGVSFSHLFHGKDERIPVEGFQWGLQVLWDLLREFAFS